MLRTMTWEQFQEWIIYDRYEPIGARRQDWQAASICNAIANVTVAANGGKKRFKVKDWLLEFGDEVKPTAAEVVKQDKQSVEQMKHTARMWAAIMNADARKQQRRRRGR